jgi:hypothetical protein
MSPRFFSTKSGIFRYLRQRRRQIGHLPLGLVFIQGRGNGVIETRNAA